MSLVNSAGQKSAAAWLIGLPLTAMACTLGIIGQQVLGIQFQLLTLLGILWQDLSNTQQHHTVQRHGQRHHVKEI